MRQAHFLHGFNVRDGGDGSIDTLAPWFAVRGFRIVEHEYGWVGPLRVRRRNGHVVRRVLLAIQPSDVLVAHSNGCLISWELTEAGAPASAVICVQPALRRDTLWNLDTRVLCLYNDGDWCVSVGRMWGRFMSVANPFRGRHGWGAAGRHGFTSGQPNVTNWDTDTGPYPVRGHSEIFRTANALHWGPKIATWAEQ